MSPTHITNNMKTKDAELSTLKEPSVDERKMDEGCREDSSQALPDRGDNGFEEETFEDFLASLENETWVPPVAVSQTVDERFTSSHLNHAKADVESEKPSKLMDLDAVQVSGLEAPLAASTGNGSREIGTLERIETDWTLPHTSTPLHKYKTTLPAEVQALINSAPHPRSDYGFSLRANTPVRETYATVPQSRTSTRRSRRQPRVPHDLTNIPRDCPPSEEPVPHSVAFRDQHRNGLHPRKHKTSVPAKGRGRKHKSLNHSDTIHAAEEASDGVPPLRNISFANIQLAHRPQLAADVKRVRDAKVGRILSMPGALEWVMKDLEKKKELEEQKRWPAGVAPWDAPTAREAEAWADKSWKSDGIHHMDNMLANLNAPVVFDGNGKAKPVAPAGLHTKGSIENTTSPTKNRNISEFFPDEIPETGEARAEFDRYNKWAGFLAEQILATRYDPKPGHWHQQLFVGGRNANHTTMLLKLQPPPRTYVAPTGDAPGHLPFVENQYTPQDPLYYYDEDGLPLEEDVFSAGRRLPGSWAQQHMEYLSSTGIQSTLSYTAEYAPRVETERFAICTYLVRPGETTATRQDRAYSQFNKTVVTSKRNILPPVLVLPGLANRPRRNPPRRNDTLNSHTSDSDKKSAGIGMEVEDIDLEDVHPYRLTKNWPEGERIRRCKSGCLNLPIESFLTSSTECASCVEYIEDFQGIPQELDSD